MPGRRRSTASSRRCPGRPTRSASSATKCGRSRRRVTRRFRARLTPRSGSRSGRTNVSPWSSARSRPTRFTSRPKGRSAWPPRATASARARVHDVVSHAVSAVRAQAPADPGEAHVRAAAPPSLSSAAHARRDGASAPRARRARVRQRRAVVARRRHGALPPARPRALAARASDLRVLRPRRRREERRRVPRSRLAGDQGRHRRRARSRDASEPLPDRRVLGLQVRRRARGGVVVGRRFVFPSRTDTFGLVLLEAMACGTPAAAYPVTGPIDVVAPGVTGVLDEDLGRAARAALALDREGCRRAASEWTWERASAQFFGHLVQARGGRDLAARVAATARASRHRFVMRGSDDARLAAPESP